MYSVFVCEASKVVRESLEKILRCYFAAKDIEAKVKGFSNPRQLCMHKESADIVFMDMDSDSELSVLVAQKLIEANPQLYLYILSDRLTHLDEAMDLRAFRYFSKNLDIDRIISSLDIIFFLDIRVTFMSNYNLMEIKESDIACIFSKDRRTIVLTVSGIYHPTTLSIKNWMSKLSASRNFIQPHYSYIVNKTYISTFDGKSIVVRCKDGKIMRIYPSQRKLSQIKNYLPMILSE